METNFKVESSTGRLDTFREMTTLAREWLEQLVDLFMRLLERYESLEAWAKWLASTQRVDSKKRTFLQISEEVRLSIGETQKKLIALGEARLSISRRMRGSSRDRRDIKAAWKTATTGRNFLIACRRPAEVSVKRLEAAFCNVVRSNPASS